MTSAFFYGALMHPKILKRVLENDACHLKICPSILSDYMRHKVKNADYPAILPCERSKALLGRELTAEENCIRGTLVSGLTAEDVALLDAFEGDQYVRLQVFVRPLGPFTPVPVDTASLIPADLPPSSAASELAQTVPAQTYAWGREDSDLDEELWSFDEFVQKNAWKWIDHGAGPQRNDDREEN
ncbi:hypothetical protein EDB92DRAFT_1846359 [Lactarius akahatsu]|uniref:Putative gamma-glutamylcyclotransferase n=1 Tax=Lactarius akahatsu TaxID=416441 RepID=A0AAD4LLU0_9AGAM|nr:hypothetical protein EDB92DRAFT_1846359 [Lactarius akahatsu]